MPPNQIEVKFKFARRRSAKVMGSLADRENDPIQGEPVRGIMVTHNFQSKIVAPQDLATFTPLRSGSILSKLHVPFAGSLSTLRLFLNEMFFGVTETALRNSEGDDGATFSIHGGKVGADKPESYVKLLFLAHISNFTLPRSKLRWDTELVLLW
jgi:hypothetical protein